MLSESVLVNSTVITYIHKNQKPAVDVKKQIDDKPKNQLETTNTKTIQKTESRLEGNATERALFKFFTNCGNLDMSDENKKQKLDDNLIFSSPFESHTKTSTIVYRCDEKEIRVCVKGSPEMMRGKIV